MITKRQIAEIIADIKTGGDPVVNSKYDPRNIGVIVDIARNTLIDTEFRQYGKISEVFTQAFKNVDVQTDTDRDEKFSDLPSIIAALKKDQGLRQVSPMKDQINVFGIGESGDRAMFHGTEGELSQRPIAMLEGQRIYYEGIGPNIKKVLIKMIPSIADIGLDESIPVPGDKETALINIVKDMFHESKTTVEDKSNDNNRQQTAS